MLTMVRKGSEGRSVSTQGAIDDFSFLLMVLVINTEYSKPALLTVIYYERSRAIFRRQRGRSSVFVKAGLGCQSG